MRIRTPSYSYTTVRRDLAPAGENARCRDVPWVASRWVGSCHEGGVTAYHSRCPARLSPSSSLCVTLPNGGYRYQLRKIRIFRGHCLGPPSPAAPHPAGCRREASAAGWQVPGSPWRSWCAWRENPCLVAAEGRAVISIEPVRLSPSRAEPNASRGHPESGSGTWARHGAAPAQQCRPTFPVPDASLRSA